MNNNPIISQLEEAFTSSDDDELVWQGAWCTVIESTENSGPAILGVSESPADSVHDTAPVDVMPAPSTPVTTPARSTGHSTASSFSRDLTAATEPETPFNVSCELSCGTFGIAGSSCSCGGMFLEEVGGNLVRVLHDDLSSAQDSASPVDQSNHSSSNTSVNPYLQVYDGYFECYDQLQLPSTVETFAEYMDASDSIHYITSDSSSSASSSAFSSVSTSDSSSVALSSVHPSSSSVSLSSLSSSSTSHFLSSSSSSSSGSLPSSVSPSRSSVMTPSSLSSGNNPRSSSSGSGSSSRFSSGSHPFPSSSCSSACSQASSSGSPSGSQASSSGSPSGFLSFSLAFLSVLGTLGSLLVSLGLSGYGLLLRSYLSLVRVFSSLGSHSVQSFNHRVLFGAMLFWDTAYAIGCLLTNVPLASSLPCPRVIRRRQSRRPYFRLLSYPRGWMILSALMLCGSRLRHPALHAWQTFGNALSLTSYRAVALSELVSFTPAVHLQFAQRRGSEVLALHSWFQLDSSGSLMLCRHLSPVRIGADVFYDPLSSSCSVQGGDGTSVPCSTGPLQVSAVPSPALMPYSGSLDPVNLHFFDAESTLGPPSAVDWLQLESPEELHYFVDCVPPKFTSVTNDSTLTSPVAPSVAAYNTAIRGLEELTGSDIHKFPVIFDSGASLAISPSRDDFIGDIRRPTAELRLGGMAHGLLVEGIGTVEWTFSSSSGSQLTVKTLCYFVPGSKARLISPQRLFCADRGIHGTFTCGEDYATLSFSNMPSLSIEYDSRSHLPIGYASNQSHNIPALNLCITDSSNQNLSDSAR